MQQSLVPELRKAIKKGRTMFPTHMYGPSPIYLVGEGAIAKPGWKSPIHNEFKWGSYLFENEVQVPEMYELVRPDSFFSRFTRFGDAIRAWFVIMQKIHGEEIGDLTGTARKEGLKQLEGELEKVLELGIYPRDSLWGRNAIFDHEQEKLFLIDSTAFF